VFCAAAVKQTLSALALRVARSGHARAKLFCSGPARRLVVAFRMPPTLHAAIYAGLLDAGMDVPRVPGEKLPTDDDGNYNPVAELALLWGSLSAGVAKDLEEQIATAEAQLQASSAGDGLSQPQSADFRIRSLKAPQEPPPSRRSLAASAQKGIPCSEPPSRLEFHLWSPRSTQPARAPQKHVVVRPSGAQAALDQLQAQATFRPGSCRRSRQQRSSAPGRDHRFETQVLRLSTPVAASVTARGAQHAPGQVPSMRCSSTPMATPRPPPPPGVAASTPARAAGACCAAPSPRGASESQDQECRNVLRNASRASTPRAAYLSAAERAYSSDTQRRRASLLYAPGSPRC